MHHELNIEDYINHPTINIKMSRESGKDKYFIRDLYLRHFFIVLIKDTNA